MKKRTYQLLILSFLIPFTSVAYNDTPNYYKCTNRKGGEWNFGRAPNICDAHHFIDPTFIERNFMDLTFFDPIERGDERRRYMTELFAVIKASAEYFIQLKNPNASEQERSNFIEASFAVAHQESFWSHYRQAQSGNTQMMRGDYGHGHGLMQVDDRWHFDAVTTGKAAHLVHNILYSLDEYYMGWRRAPSQRCVDSATSWEQRARAAYSAYNGGPSKICRWTNPNDRWARNDKGFFAKYTQRSWQNYVEDYYKLPSVDVICLAEGGMDCKQGQTEPQTPREKTFYQISSGETCLYQNDSFLCVEQKDDRSCLQSYLKISSPVSDEVFNYSYDIDEKNVLDRHSVCKSIAGFIPVGETIEVKKNINVRLSPGGKLISTTKKGEKFQIIDFSIYADESVKRYYKIKVGNDTGWIYSGNKTSHQEWVSVSEELPKEKLIANKGDKVTTLRELTLWDANRNPLFQVDEKTNTIVIQRNVQGTNNQLFYEVEVDATRGYLFVGALTPEMDIYDNLKVAPQKEYEQEHEKPSQFAKVKGWYKSVRDCASSSCKRIRFLWGGSNVKVLSIQNGWAYIQFNGIQGYLKSKSLEI